MFQLQLPEIGTLNREIRYRERAPYEASVMGLGHTRNIPFGAHRGYALLPIEKAYPRGFAQF